MDRRPRISDRFTAWRRRLQRTRLECRECEVICERVVSPQNCLDSGCTAVYVYEDGETKMFGCLHKVFLPSWTWLPSRSVPVGPAAQMATERCG